jgi:hypothetical protein
MFAKQMSVEDLTARRAEIVQTIAADGRETKRLEKIVAGHRAQRTRGITIDAKELDRCTEKAAQIADRLSGLKIELRDIDNATAQAVEERCRADLAQISADESKERAAEAELRAEATRHLCALAGALIKLGGVPLTDPALASGAPEQFIYAAGALVTRSTWNGESWAFDLKATLPREIRALVTPVQAEIAAAVHSRRDRRAETRRRVQEYARQYGFQISS